MTAFRVFSGWDKRQAEAAEVFAFSVRENASIDVAVHFVSSENTPTSVAACRRRGVTAFTYARFAVPYACGFEGRALYGDGCDQLCLGDVKELAELDMQGKPVWVVKHADDRRVPRDRPRSWSSLMLLDCSQCKAWTPDGIDDGTVDLRLVDDRLMGLRDFKDDQIGSLPDEWNQLVEPGNEPPEDAKIAHYSALADPDIGSWIRASRSVVWESWRQKWRAAKEEPHA